MLRLALFLGLVGAIMVGGLYLLEAVLAIGDSPMTGHGYTALTLGIVFTVALGAALVYLLYRSHASGHDEEVDRMARYVSGEEMDPPGDPRP